MIDPFCSSAARRTIAARNGSERADSDGMLHHCLAVPDWVVDEVKGALIHHRHVRMTTIDRECIVCAHVLDAIALVSVHLPHANELIAEDFRRGVGEVYRLIRSALVGSSAPFPVRMWNFIPGIHHQIDGELDRYQVFNQARHAAFLEWLGSSEAFASNLPTATGIGHAGDALVVHALATAERGRPHENPRQTPAFRYSCCFGPRPPCFSRAVVAPMPKGRRLLIGGTASVRGEESVQIDSLSGQLDELLENLRSLMAIVVHDHRGSLESIREVRVYHRFPEHRDELNAIIARQFTGARRLDSIQADICRRELLLEIEAVADILPLSSTTNGSGANGIGHVSS